MGNVAELTDAEFEKEVLKSDVPVLVDFWAPWCGPCRQIAPLIEELAADNQGAVKVVKVNIDESLDVSQRYGIMSIPTLMIFKGGEVVEKFVGGRPKTALQQALDAAKA
jgi:thioredoxin 1